MNDVPQPSLAKSLIASTILHGLIVLFIVFLAKPKPLPEVASIEASLVGDGDLAGIQGQIAKAHAKAQAQSKISTQPQSTSNTPQMSEPISNLNDELAQRESEYRAQMQAHAKALDQDIASEMTAYQQALDEADRERQRQVNELERRERSNDEIAKENAKELQNAQRQLEQQAKQKSAQSSASDGTPNLPTVGSGQGHSQSGGSSGNSAHAGSSSGNRGSAISAIQERIYRNWSPEAGLKGKRLSATIRVDGSGNLTGIQFGLGDDALRPSLERAIRASAPFPEAAGTLTHFTANFHAD